MKKTLAFLDRRFLGSNIALLFGVLSLLAGLGQMNSLPMDRAGTLIITGIVMIIGVTAYKSAKKRKLEIAQDNKLRKIIEFSALIIVFVLIFLQNNIKERIVSDPFPNIIIPIWIFVAYIIISVKRNMQ